MRRVLLIALGFLALAVHGGQAMNPMEIYIRKTVENFRKQMKIGIPEIKMPVLDPLKIPLINVRINEKVADVKLKITQLMCNDLATFNIKSVNVDLATLRVSAVIVLPRGTAQAAEYDLDGLILKFIPLYGKGKAGFVINDLEIKIDTTLDLGTGRMQLRDFKIKFEFSQIQVYLENILGGGQLGDVVNTVINSFGKAIFDGQKHNAERTLNTVIRTALNKELAKINLGKIGNPSNDAEALYDTATANAEIDTLMKKIRPNLATIDSITLPYGKVPFNENVFIGYTEVYDGTAIGLSTISRDGDAIVITNPKSGASSITAFLTVTDLHVSFKSTLDPYPTTLLNPGPRGVTSATVAITILRNKVGESKLQQLEIVDLPVPQMTVGDIGSLRELFPILRVMENLAANQTMIGMKAALENDVRRVIDGGLARLRFSD